MCSDRRPAQDGDDLLSTENVYPVGSVIPVRRRRVPEVVQTSNLDCGPAALSALLTGLGLHASYEQLRDLCATDVDGTSIDAMEAVAVAAGTDAEQMVVPAEHILLLPDEYLPAIVVTELPDGFTHFVVIWSRRGNRFQVMDPAHGRRWLKPAQVLAELYRHTASVPAQAWREWAGSPVFTEGLTARLRASGIPVSNAEHLISVARADEGVDGLRNLDAAIRQLEVTGQGTVEIWLGTDLPEGRYSCRPLTDDMVALSGAVIVRARHFDPVKADPELLDRLARVGPRASELIRRNLPRPGLAVWVVIIAATISAIGYIAETLALQQVLDAATPSSKINLPLVAAVVVGAALWTLACMWIVRAQGRIFEVHLRTRVASTLARLPDAWTRSRPLSDLAERSHLLHRLRDLPGQLFQLVFGLATVAAAAVILAVRTPAALPFVVLLAAVSVAGPAIAVRAAAERDLRLRTLAGGLTRYTEDALLGAEAVYSSNGRAAIEHEHERTLTHWRAAGLALVATASTARAVLDVLTIGLGCQVVVMVASHAGPAWAVIGGLLVLQLIDGGAQLTDLLRSSPVIRSVLLRIAAWLGAVQNTDAVPGNNSGVTDRNGGIRLDGVKVQIGPVELLSDVNLHFPVGTHVAVVGPSGGGKTTLLGVLLGTIEPTAGTVRLPGGRRPVAWVAVETRIWNTTVNDNVCYGDPSSADSVAERLTMVEFTDVNTRLMANGNPNLGEGGRRLSDGQAQRIRIGRALGRRDAELVVLDEPFQGLERDRRRRFLRATRGWWADRTLICATHDIEDTVDFDLVVVVRAGRIIETGSPQSLLTTDSSYRQLLQQHQAIGFPGTWQSIELAPTRPQES